MSSDGKIAASIPRSTSRSGAAACATASPSNGPASLTFVGEVLERACACPLPRLGFDDAVADLDDGLDREQRAQAEPSPTRPGRPFGGSPSCRALRAREPSRSMASAAASAASRSFVAAATSAASSTIIAFAKRDETSVDDPYVDPLPHLLRAGARSLVGRGEPRREREAHDAGASVIGRLREASRRTRRAMGPRSRATRRLWHTGARTPPARSASSPRGPSRRAGRRAGRSGCRAARRGFVGRSPALSVTTLIPAMSPPSGVPAPLASKSASRQASRRVPPRARRRRRPATIATVKRTNRPSAVVRPDSGEH